jgi:uncharacterized protein (DUF1501 family)
MRNPIMRPRSVKDMSRREFLRLLAGIIATPLAGALSELAYGAGPFNDYRALVCVFIFGGNDAHNMIVPLDARYAAYATNRGPLALPQESFAATTVSDPAQGAFGLHPRMTRSSALFRSGKLAVVPNVGVLVRPTTRADFDAKRELPPQLFSHNDMQAHWYTSWPQASASTGWGGRLGDLLQSANTGPLSVSIAAAQSNIFMKGNVTSAQQVSPYGVGNTIAFRPGLYRAWDTANANPQGIYEGMMKTARTNVLEQQFAEIAGASMQVNGLILDTLYNPPNASGQYTEKYPIATAFPAGEPLAQQLRSVAMMIAGRQALGVKRQIFFVAAYGFDNHSDQYATAASTLKPGPNDPAILFGNHADLLERVDVAMKAFYDATVELGVSNNVTTFTASDFGRTLTSNGQGSDHGWGAHHLVMGGAVKGGRLYGTFPSMEVGAANPADAGQGRLIPDTSVDQYAGTLARWMGASAADLGAVFPNLANFSQPDLGFLG